MLTKSDAVQTTTERDRAGFVALEKRIDEALLRYNGKPLPVDVTSVEERVVSRIQSAYCDAGWHVTRRHDSSDQRDPRERDTDWLVFA